MRRQYVTIFLIQVTEILGFSLILPFLPLMVQDFGANEFQVGLVLMVYSFFQFFSAPLLGRLSDFWGRKPVLVISQASTCLSFVILGFADSLSMVVLSRLIDGLFGSNYTVAQAYLSDISTKKSRSRAMALSEIAFAVGMVVSPGIGGLLAIRWGYSIPAFLAAIMSFTSIIMTLVFLHEPIQRKRIKQFGIKRLFQLHQVFKTKQIRSSLVQLIFYFLVQGLFVFTFALFANQRVGATTFEIGLMLAYVGVLSILARMLIVLNWMKWLREKQLLWFGYWLMVIGLLIALVDNTYVWLLAGISLFAIGSGWYRPLMIGSLSRQVNKSFNGGMLGIINAFASLTQIVAPFLGGLLLFIGDTNWFLITGLGLLGMMVIIKMKD